MFEPENELERSLVRAAAEPAHGPVFLRAMFNGTAFVALEFDGAPPVPNAEGKVVLPEGTKLRLRTVRVGDQVYLPFFTAASRARAALKGKFVIAPNVTREFFERHPGKQFVLNPGHEYTRTLSSDDVNLLLAGQFDAVAALSPTATPAAGGPAAAEPPSAAKVGEPKSAETKSVGATSSAVMPPEPKPPGPTPEAPKPVALRPAATEPPVVSSTPAAPERPPVVKPAVLDTPVATKPVFAEESFVFNPFVTAPPSKPAAVNAAASGNPAPNPVSDEAKPEAIKSEPLTSEAAATSSAPIAASEAKPRAVKLAMPEQSARIPNAGGNQTGAAKPDAVAVSPAPVLAPAGRPSAVRAAASETLAAWRRMTARRSGSDKSQITGAPPAIKPVARDALAASGPSAAEEAPVAAKPIAAKPIAAKPIAAKPIVLPPASPGATIGKPDPYPVEVLLALTAAFQRAPAIEAACVGEAQFPGRPALLVVALTSAESWDSLVETLGPTLRKALPPGRAVEFTPFPGGMYEEYFRIEAQPFFKKR